MSRFDPTRLLPGRTGRNDKLVPGMRVFADVDAFHNTDVCTITAVGLTPTRNIRVVDSEGEVRILSIWQIRSTLPATDDPADVIGWADA